MESFSEIVSLEAIVSASASGVRLEEAFVLEAVVREEVALAFVLVDLLEGCREGGIVYFRALNPRVVTRMSREGYQCAGIVELL